VYYHLVNFQLKTPHMHREMKNIRVYLVVIDIRIVDCHMYPGEHCPPSLVL